MEPEILFFYPKNFLWDNTLGLAVPNMATKHNLTCENRPYTLHCREVFDGLKENLKCKLAFFEFNPDYTKENYETIRAKLPNAKILMFDSDCIYCGEENSIVWPLDLLITTTQHMVGKCTKFPAEHFFWNISETIIYDISVMKGLGVLPKEKTWESISLCRKASHERHGFFNEFLGSGREVKWGLDKWDLVDIYKCYAQSWFVIGHTTPVFTGQGRSMKGFRDWLGPFLGSLLIYDDYPDFEEMQQILPTYKYLNVTDCLKLMDKLKADLRLYHEYIEKQKVWALENTLEKQLERILLKYGWL